MLNTGFAATNHWNNVVSPDFEQVTTAFGIGFAPDGQTGYTGVGLNDLGSQIWKTNDAGGKLYSHN